jgi:hypothetical protein
MKLKDLIFENSSAIYAALDKAVPDNANINDFAIAVGKFLKEEYGSHNIQPFMETLHKELGLDESVNEEVKKSFKLSDLTFDIVSDLFGGVKPGRGVAFPLDQDANRIVFSEDDFNQWKQSTNRKYGDVTVHLFPEETAYIKQVKIEDEKFQTARTASIQGKAAWLDKERELGRSTD